MRRGAARRGAQVSDRIVVASKSNDEATTWEWESQLGASTYSIRESTGAPPSLLRLPFSGPAPPPPPSARPFYPGFFFLPLTL